MKQSFSDQHIIDCLNTHYGIEVIKQLFSKCHYRITCKVTFTNKARIDWTGLIAEHITEAFSEFREE